MLKEILINIRGALSLNRDYEFDANLKSHEVGDGNIYRLYNIYYSRAGERYGRRGFNV